MTRDMIKQIAERIMNKVYIEREFSGKYENNRRENPFHSERKGMEEMLKMMGIKFEYGFDDNYEINSIQFPEYNIIQTI